MNREIKFRVWNKKTNKWIHRPGSEINLFGETILYGGFMGGLGIDELNDCVALQYTGLKDETGKEIYEGDIVEVNFRKCGTQVCRVDWDIMGFEFYLLETKNIPSFPMSIKDTPIECKIIGNIFENPELLK